MNYQETMLHLTNEIAEREHCTRTKARAFLAASLRQPLIRNQVLFQISHRECCFPEIADTE